MLAAFEGPLATRQRCLFLLGLHTGYRITELLSLRVRDVWERGRPVSHVYVQRRHMKGSRAGRAVVLHPRAAAAVTAWVEELRPLGYARPHHVLFRSWQHGGVHGHAIDRIQAWKLLRRAYDAAGLSGRLGTHSMRKSYAARAHRASGGDLRRTQEALDHGSPDSTARYIGEDREGIDELVLTMWEDGDHAET